MLWILVQILMLRFSRCRKYQWIQQILEYWNSIVECCNSHSQHRQILLSLQVTHRYSQCIFSRISELPSRLGSMKINILDVFVEILKPTHGKRYWYYPQQRNATFAQTQISAGSPYQLEGHQLMWLLNPFVLALQYHQVHHWDQYLRFVIFIQRLLATLLKRH